MTLHRFDSAKAISAGLGVGAGIEIYATCYRGISPRTMEQRRIYLKRYREFLEREGISSHEQVAPLLLEQYIAELRARLKKRSLNCHIDALRSLYGYLYEQGTIATNPAKHLRKIRISEADNNFVILDEEEQERLLAEPDRKTWFGVRDHAILTFLLETGVRVGEFAAMSLEDLDLETNFAIVRHPEKDSPIRQIPLSARCLKALWPYLRQHPSGQSGDPLWVTEDGEPLSVRRIQEIVTGYAEKAGVPRVSPHDLRHTFATMYLVYGGDPISLRKLLGHATLELVDYYVRLAGLHLERIRARVEQNREKAESARRMHSRRHKK